MDHCRVELHLAIKCMCNSGCGSQKAEISIRFQTRHPSTSAEVAGETGARAPSVQSSHGVHASNGPKRGEPKMARLASSFRLLKQHTGCFTGGKVVLSTNETFLACYCGEEVKILDIEKGEVIRTISTEQDGILSFALHPNDKELVTSGRSNLLKHWNLETGECIRTWKGWMHYVFQFWIALTPLTSVRQAMTCR